MKNTKQNKLRLLLILVMMQVSFLSLFALPAVKAGANKSKLQTTYYGAIAYSPSTGRFGSSWNSRSSDEANKLAMGICNRPDCQVLVPLENSCGALARARNGGYVWGSGGSLYEAKLLTSNECTRRHGSCKFICSVCSRGNEP